MYITFENSSDAEDAYKLLIGKIHGTSELFKINIKESCTLHIEMFKEDINIIHTYIVPALTQFVFKCKEHFFFKKIISNVFYFHDEAEQQNIIQMVYSLLCENELEESPNRQELVSNALTVFLNQPLSFSFEAFVTFRLKEYFNRLEHLIELAIDEYKIEQEYQDFIEGLRKYIHTKESACDFIHVVHEDNKFLFFDERYKSITHHIQLIEEDFVNINGLEVDKQVIAPLLFLSPKEIHLYSTDYDNGIVQTLMNIFQEKIKYHRYNEFTRYRN
jgi:putative sporulation protein YtxC